MRKVAILALLFALPGAQALGISVDAGLPLAGEIGVTVDRAGLRVETPPLPIESWGATGLTSILSGETARSQADSKEGTESPATDPVAAALVAAAAGLAMGGLGPLATLALGIWFSLYSRIAPAEALAHGTRQRIADLVREQPGITLMSVHAALGTGWGTTMYHLQRLERDGLLVSEKRGHERLYFLPGLHPKGARDEIAALRGERESRLARFVAEHPGATQREIAQALGVLPSVASKGLTALESAGLVRREREGRIARVFPT